MLIIHRFHLKKLKNFLSSIKIIFDITSLIELEIIFQGLCLLRLASICSEQSGCEYCKLKEYFK